MSISIETVAFGGWNNNLRLKNGKIELIVTLEVGPRVLCLQPTGTESNVFCVFPEDAGGSGEASWKSRGGHRLWLAPESADGHPFTYFPDNGPVEYEELGEGHVVFRSAAETSGVQKELEINLHGDEARATVTHRLVNTGGETLAPLAPWALSVMAAGGVCVVPQPELGEHPRDLLPNRGLVLWPYTNLQDPRLYLGTGFFTLSQDTARGPIKLGLGSQLPWVGYWNDGLLFVKKWHYDSSAQYPDLGSGCELFTNEAMLEVESLGPEVELTPGQSVEHIEEWSLFSDVPAFDARDEAQIGAAFSTVAGL